MKKFYMIAATLFVANLGISQDSNDSLTFESKILEVDSFYNGADGLGNIQIGNFNLTNVYDLTYHYFSGFAISNVSDITTAGPANQYASFTGGGSNSTNYGIYYLYGTISFPSPYLISGLELTNTTYAALSMRDGDAFAKKFGSVNGANGQPDGTNGEDYFLLKIIPLNATDGAMGDTIDFYLADFRFADDAQDYILDTWESVTFPNNGIVANKLKFELSSSDSGVNGMNTPAYFAFDNLVASPSLGLNENTVNWSVYPNPTSNQLFINSEKEGSISILNNLGQTVYESQIQQNASVSFSHLPAGIYFATLKTAQGESVKKIVKL